MNRFGSVPVCRNKYCLYYPIAYYVLDECKENCGDTDGSKNFQHDATVQYPRLHCRYCDVGAGGRSWLFFALY